MNRTIGLIGGDRRQAELAKLLRDDGFEVFTYGLEPNAPEESLERAVDAEIVILPLPLCCAPGMLNCKTEEISIRELLDRFRPEQRLLAGQVKPEQRLEAEERGLVLEDYFLREEMTVANAAATAESAIRVVMENQEQTLLGKEALVLGFGRIGKLLANRLQGLGVRVNVAARKTEDLAWIRAYGWNAIPFAELNGKLRTMDLVINTAPSPIFGKEHLKQLPKTCLLVDLASVQGIDATAAGALGLTCIWARSLPGRMVPRTAAAIMRDTMYNILLEERSDLT